MRDRLHHEHRAPTAERNGAAGERRPLAGRLGAVDFALAAEGAAAQAGTRIAAEESRVKRCTFQGKRKFRNAGEAARYVQPGERRGFYRCPHCHYFHLTKKIRREAAA